MPHFTESLDALRREAPARFLETDQFAEMLSTYHKLKPLAESKPKSFAKQCAEYDFTRIYPLMDAFLAANGYVSDLSGVRLHHEIYLSDARKVARDKLRTVIRHPIRRL